MLMLRLRQLLARSRDLPLQVTILARGCLRHYGTSFSYAFDDHRQRIVRIHLEYSSETQFLDFLKYCNFDLPAVRTLSAGFDDREIHYDDIPVRSANPKCLPVLSQVVFGASACIPWCCIPLPGVQELTLTPDNVRPVSNALTSCTNLSRLTILMAQFNPPSAQQAANPDVQRFLDDVARVPQLCFGQIAAAHETFLLTAFNDARFRHLTLDYCGRVRRRSSGRYLSLPSPCDALRAPVRVTLTLRDGVYGITVFDVEDHRQDIYMDESTIRLAPGLWEFYLKQQTVSSATVDANAWHYFAVGLPTECAIPELTVVVLQRATELQRVTLERFSSLHTLRINGVAHGLKLSSASVRSLVRSRANCDGGEALLSVLSLSPNAAYDASIAIFMSDFCDIIDH